MNTFRFSILATCHDLTVPAAAIALVTVTAGGSSAGSLDPVAAPVVIAPAAAPVDIWRGIYLGGDIAYAWGGDDEVGHRAPSGQLLSSPATLEQHGVNYGLRLGWRGQRALADRTFVYGVELGYDFGAADDSFDANGYSGSITMNDVLSLRLKSGLTNAAGDTLFYGILGYIRGDFDYSLAGTTAGDTMALDTGFDTDGFSVGLGVERKLNRNWSLTLEWEYLEFDSQMLFDSGGSSTKATPKYNNISFGANYSF